MSSRGANLRNACLSPRAREWYANALIFVSDFHQLPHCSDLRLSKGDVEFVRAALDVGVAEASKCEHIDDILHQCAATCVIWLAQQTRAEHTGDWVVHSLASQVNLSFRGMQMFLQYQHPITHTKPFQLQFRTPEEELSKRRRGAQWLSDCMTTGGLPPLHPNIIAQLPPAEVEDPAELWRSTRQRVGVGQKL